jgi:hypothetical protein
MDNCLQINENEVSIFQRMNGAFLCVSLRYVKMQIRSALYKIIVLLNYTSLLLKAVTF